MFTLNLHMNVYSSSVHDYQNLEAAQVSFSGWVEKQTVRCLYDGILLGKKRERTMDMHSQLG